MDEKKIFNLLQRYHQGKCSPEERTIIEAWYREQLAANDTTPWNNEQEKEAISSQLRDRLLSTIRPDIPKKRLHLLHYAAFAATILLLITAGVVLYRFSRPDSLNTPTAFTEYATFKTAKGEIRKVTLMDGTTILLNSLTHIRIPRHNGNSKRTVEIVEGEAFFDVKQDPHRPFEVNSGNMETRVLGTSFNIRNYAFMQDTKITVQDGSVLVYARDEQHADSVHLKGNEQVLFENGTLVKSTTDGSLAGNWQTGGLHFDADVFSGVARLLEDRFGVNIRFQDPETAKYRITASFDRSESLGHVLQVLNDATDTRHSRRDKTIIIYKTP